MSAVALAKPEGGRRICWPLREQATEATKLPKRVGQVRVIRLDRPRTIAAPRELRANSGMSSLRKSAGSPW